jgi:hypothetical protein
MHAKLVQCVTAYLHWFVSLLLSKAAPKQGDQIGRNFAQWAIVYFGELYKNYRSSPKFSATFFQSIDNVQIKTDKNRFGYILGDFFTN